MGRLLRMLRERAGVSQAKAAHGLGVTQATVSRWERDAAVPSSRDLGVLLELVNASDAERAQALRLAAEDARAELAADASAA